VQNFVGETEWLLLHTGMVIYHQFHQSLVQSEIVPSYEIWHKRWHSVLPTKLFPYLTAYTTGSYTQLFQSMLYAVGQKKSA